jgi:TPP-dependent pyruvate/acetoin dehydrogenase alpha subunit
MGDQPLPDAAVAKEWLAAMLLIRRFEERAGELYAEGRIGGSLRLAIGEEATIVCAPCASRTTWSRPTARTATRSAAARQCSASSATAPPTTGRSARR